MTGKISMRSRIPPQFVPPLEEKLRGIKKIKKNKQPPKKSRDKSRLRKERKSSVSMLNTVIKNSST